VNLSNCLEFITLLITLSHMTTWCENAIWLEHWFITQQVPIWIYILNEFWYSWSEISQWLLFLSCKVRHCNRISIQNFSSIDFYSSINDIFINGSFVISQIIVKIISHKKALWCPWWQKMEPKFGCTNFSGWNIYNLSLQCPKKSF